jgi:hypothetical protein
MSARSGSACHKMGTVVRLSSCKPFSVDKECHNDQILERLHWYTRRGEECCKKHALKIEKKIKFAVFSQFLIKIFKKLNIIKKTNSSRFISNFSASTSFAGGIKPPLVISSSLFASNSSFLKNTQG